MKKQVYTWKHVESMVQDLVHQLYKSPWKPDYLVGLTRGGLTPAVMLSNRLNIPMYALDVRLRDTHKDYEPESNCWMAEDAFGYVTGGETAGTQWDIDVAKNILIVDDINDTGETIKWIKQDWPSGCLPAHDRWRHVFHNNVKFAVLTNNLSSDEDVDFYVDEVNKAEKPVWLVYPWE